MKIGTCMITYPRGKAVLNIKLFEKYQISGKIYIFGTFFYRGEIVMGNIELNDFLKVNKMNVIPEGDTNFKFKNKNGNIPNNPGNSVDWIYGGDVLTRKKPGFESFNFKEVFLYEGIKVRRI